QTRDVTGDASIAGSVLPRLACAASSSGLVHEFKPRVLAQPPPELARRLPVSHDDVCLEVVRAADERGADTVSVHRHAALLEQTDLVHGEASGGVDPNVTEAVGIEHITHHREAPRHQ